MTPIRVAIIGAGIGAQHLAGYRAAGAPWQVRVICDRDPDRAAPLLDGAPGADLTLCTDLAAVLADPGIDLVDICLPPHLHVPVALAALEAGKHVVCEKPIAPSLTQALSLAQAAADAGRICAPVFQYRFGPGLAQLRALIRAGVAGRPYSAALETHWDRRADYYAEPWRGTWAGETGGAILGHAIHIHDLMVHLLGPVAQVRGHLATRVNPIETEDCAALSFAMASGALVTSSVTLGAAGDHSHLSLSFEGLTATSGTLPYAPGDGTWRFTARGADQAEIDRIAAATPPGLSGFAGYFAALAPAIAGRDAPDAVTLADGIASIELATAIYRAARGDRAVALPLDRAAPDADGWGPP